MAKQTKGIKIKETVGIIRKGYSCVSPMPWETPFVDFLTSKYGVVRWLSDRVDEVIPSLEKGDSVFIECFIYPQAPGRWTARRVKFPTLLK